MAKSLNLSFTGGMPLTQEGLAQLQNATIEMGMTLGRMGFDGNANPVIVSGCLLTGPGNTYGDGWIYYNGGMHYFAGGNLDADGSFLSLNTLTTSVVYEDNSIKPLYVDTRFVLASLGTISFALCPRIQHGIGAYAEDYTELLTLTVPGLSLGLSGNVYMRRNELSQTLHIWGSISTTSAQSFPAPPQYKNVFSSTDIPSKYRPVTTTPFAMFVRYHLTNYIQETNTTEHITHLNAELTAGGDLNVGFLKPAAAVSAYTVVFNTIVPLK